MEKNFLLKIAYDGSCFSGWQKQPDKRTVQGTLEDTLSAFTGIQIKLNGTSRTDAGVHALGQCASFSGEFSIPPEGLMKAANDRLSGGMNRKNNVGDVEILSIEEMPPDFHARFDCKGKTYRYVINSSPERDIFRRNYCYWIPERLDTDAMRLAAGYIIGEHDFKAFQASGGTERETTVRTITDVSVFTSDEKADDVIIEVTGDGFLYNMVRIITGTLVEVGLGKRTPESVRDTIESEDRARAGHTAPAEGLYLKEIYY
ncbi:MAG: tRNA pseudouridine(38-40) synthase TruA [Firmicutes bacterium]|nr:tRNA pseudouridine(38-40) synthase TruA [Bacillota bacterium]